MKPSPRASLTVGAGGARSPGSDVVGGAPGWSSHPPGGPHGPGHVSGAASGHRLQAGEHRGGSGSRCAGRPGRLCVARGTRLRGGGTPLPGVTHPEGVSVPTGHVHVSAVSEGLALFLNCDS